MKKKVFRKQDEDELEERLEEEEEVPEEEEEEDKNNVEKKVDALMAKVAEISDIVGDLAEAVKSVVDVNRGIQETVMKTIEEINLIKESLPSPEEENKKVEAELRDAPAEPEPAESAEAEIDIKPEDVQREPEYEFGETPNVGKAVAKAKTPRPEMDKDTEILKRDVSGLSDLIQDVLKGKATVGEIEEKLKNVIKGEVM